MDTEERIKELAFRISHCDLIGDNSREDWLAACALLWDRHKSFHIAKWPITQGLESMRQGLGRSGFIDFVQDLMTALEDEAIPCSVKIKVRELLAEDDLPKVKTVREPSKTFIYVMRNNRNGLIKIGRSKNLKVREATLQSEEPEVELLLVKEGIGKDEDLLHSRYECKRVRGEWFALSIEDLEELKARNFSEPR